MRWLVAPVGLFALLNSPAFSQTASQIMRPSFRPELSHGGGIGDAGGAEKLTVKLSGAHVSGGLPQLAEATAALKARLSARRITGAEIFAAARELEAAYSRAGFVLVRVILPPQHLVNDSKLRLTVVDGFIERVETKNLPETVRARIERLVGPLIGQHEVTLRELGRRVLLAAGHDKVYDGTTAATVTFGDNHLAGDTLTISGAALFGDKNVGAGKTVSASGITLTGADSDNYTFNTTATTSASITPFALTMIATGQTKIYDGTQNAAATFSDNRLAGDNLTITGSTLFSDKNVGAGKAVSVSGIALGGADAGNYTVTNTMATTAADIIARADGSGERHRQGPRPDDNVCRNRILDQRPAEWREHRRGNLEQPRRSGDGRHRKFALRNRGEPCAGRHIRSGQLHHRLRRWPSDGGASGIDGDGWHGCFRQRRSGQPTRSCPPGVEPTDDHHVWRHQCALRRAAFCGAVRLLR